MTARHLIRLIVLVTLALVPCLPAKADGVNQFRDIPFSSYNGPGTLDIGRFLSFAGKVGAAGVMTLDDDPELGPFGWGWYVTVAPTEGGVALHLTASGRLTDPVTIEFTRGVSTAQDAIIDALLAATDPATIAALLNTLRGLYP